MTGVETVPFWDTVVINAAPIIIALTGFGAMLGGFYMQYRMMNKQNQKIDRNAEQASSERDQINTKIDRVTETTNGLAQRNEQIARNLGVVEGTAAGLKQGREENGNSKE